MRILVVEPAKVPEARNISGSLEEMQSIVGGYIKVIYPFPGIALICNEDGWVRGLPGNRGLRDENGEVHNIIWGTFFLCGVSADSEDFAGLLPEQVEQLEKQFHTPEAFVGSNGVFCAFRFLREPSRNSVKALPSRKSGMAGLFYVKERR